MRFRWLFASAAIVIVAAGYFGWQRHRDHQQAVAILRDWKQQQDLDKKLDRPVRIHFGKTVREEEWLAEWSRQSGIPVQRVESHHEVFVHYPWHEFSLDLPQLPARTALQCLERFHSYRWNLASDQLAIGKSYDESTPPQVQLHPLSPSLARLSEDDLRELLQLVSWHWPAIDVQRSNIVPGGIVHRGYSDQQQSFASLLHACQQIVEHAARKPGNVPDDPWWEPIPLGTDGAALAELLRKLDEPVSLRLVDATLADFARQIEEQAGVAVCFSKDDETWTGNFTKIHCQADRLPLREILQLVLSDAGMFWMPMPGGSAIYLSRNDFGPFETACRVPLAYPLHDLIENIRGRPSAERIMEAITVMVEPDDWYDHAGPGSLTLWEGYLIAPLPLYKHYELRELLRGLRRVRGGVQGPTLRCGFDNPRSQQMLAAYNQPVKLSYRGEPLTKVLAELRQQHSLPIYLSSRISGALIEPNQPVWCHLPAAPLRINLDILLRSFDLAVAVYPHYLLVMPSTNLPADGQQLAVWDIRGPLGKNQSGNDADRLEYFLEASLAELTRRSQLPAQRVSGLLVVQQTHEELNAAEGLFALARSGIYANTPQLQGTGKLRGEALNQPVPIRIPIALDEASLLEKLQVGETIQVRELPLREILWQLTEQHDLPISPILVPNGGLDFDKTTRFECNDLPLAEVLQQLIGGPEVGWWDTSGGYLRISTVAPEEVSEEATFKADHQFDRKLFFVGDLIAPRGRHTPQDLSTRIENDIIDSSAAPGFDSSFLEANSYFDSFLIINCRPSHMETIAATLRTLRQEAQP